MAATLLFTPPVPTQHHLLLAMTLSDRHPVLQARKFLLYATLFFTILISGAGAATTFLTSLTEADHVLLW